jgi:hypothetical protein
MPGLRHSPPPLVLSVAVLALWCVPPGRADAGPILQDVSNEARNISPWVGQTFTAEDAQIGIAGVYVQDFTFGSVATDPTIVYALYDGAGAGGALLGSRTFSGLVEGFSGFADVSFAGVPLIVGNVYSLLVSNDTGQWGVESAFIAGGTYYTGGTALLSPDFGPGLPPRDLRFHVLPAVPEPAVLTLLGIGLASVIARRRHSGDRR